MRVRVSLLLSVVTFLTLVLAVPAAHAATTLVVDDDGHAAPGSCGSSAAAHATIQAAVNAASPFDTIQVCPGTYHESVNVTKPLTIDGNKAGVDARTRGTTNESNVVAASGPAFKLDAEGIVLDGFSVKSSDVGVQTTPAYGGYLIQNVIANGNTIGLYLNSSTVGTTPTHVFHSKVVNNNRAGSSSGNGIYSDQGLFDANIEQNLFSSDDNAGIFVGGLGGNGIQILSNEFRNLANSAVTFFDSVAGGNINSNLMVNGSRNANGGSAVFVGGTSSRVQIIFNTITTPNFSGIAIRGTADQVIIRSNTVRNAGGSGIDVSTTTSGGASTTFNTTKANKVDGIFYAAGTGNNEINNNTSKNNSHFDCEDQNGAGTTNAWSANNGVTASPPGIC